MPAGVLGFVGLVGLAAPPVQLLRSTAGLTSSTMLSTAASLRARTPRSCCQHRTAAANAVSNHADPTGSLRPRDGSGQRGPLCSPAGTPLAAVVVIVNVLVRGPLAGVTVLGEKLAVVCPGNPVALRLTALGKGFIVIVTVPA